MQGRGPRLPWRVTSQRAVRGNAYGQGLRMPSRASGPSAQLPVVLGLRPAARSLSRLLVSLQQPSALAAVSIGAPSSAGLLARRGPVPDEPPVPCRPELGLRNDPTHSHLASRQLHVLQRVNSLPCALSAVSSRSVALSLGDRLPAAGSKSRLSSLTGSAGGRGARSG